MSGDERGGAWACLPGSLPPFQRKRTECLLQEPCAGEAVRVPEEHVTC